MAKGSAAFPAPATPPWSSRAMCARGNGAFSIPPANSTRANVCPARNGIRQQKYAVSQAKLGELFISIIYYFFLQCGMNAWTKGTMTATHRPNALTRTIRKLSLTDN
jgi:hypothetical protein